MYKFTVQHGSRHKVKSAKVEMHNVCRREENVPTTIVWRTLLVEVIMVGIVVHQQKGPPLKYIESIIYS
ncbi:predicted protein [Lichtheimia corymbifera JMRC:FSU:9682]|uniref:Uncharacterized protein n=1 Tax=Lichtheimia corymbifera JMRC:FSU:9682 TaxID=1263082 RepID=A0A068RZX6_9FUNG|nr:predicted protein [Lichtheimia corymbifera JMRC:FSU:9682]